MILAEAPFWVWGLVALDTSLFLFMCLAPFLWEWHQEYQAKTKPQPVPLLIESRQV